MPDFPVVIVELLLAGGIDDARWLATAPFDAVQCGLLLREGPAEPTTFRVRRRVLETDTVIDARALPADPSWFFLRLVQDVLVAVGERYGLGDPPLHGIGGLVELGEFESGGPEVGAEFPLPPVDRDAPADVGADLDALEDDEVLVVVPDQLPGEDEQALLERRLRLDAVLTDLFRAPPRGSSATGSAYVFVLGLPAVRRRWRRR